MSERVTLDDLESKLREIGGTVQTSANEAKSTALGAGAAVSVVLVAAVYFLGRRRGRKEAPVLEIRRI